LPAFPAESQESFGSLLAEVVRLLRSDFVRRARSNSLGPQQHRLLLAAHGLPGCRQIELARRLDLSPVTVGRMLDRLEAQGLIRRERHPLDRRATRVYLERKALSQVHRLADTVDETHERAFAGIGAEQRQALVDGLRQVRENLMATRKRAKAPRRDHGR
jgi:DNA-binding MarR family transcriptional regulator